jgi:hypothetical protein
LPDAEPTSAAEDAKNATKEEGVKAAGTPRRRAKTATSKSKKTRPTKRRENL